MRLRAATVVDGYKLSHAAMYADGTESVYSNFTPRSNKIYLRNATSFYDGKLVFIGVQGALQEITEMWADSFFNIPVEAAVGRFTKRVEGYLGGAPNAVAVLESLHALGYLPLLVKALPEGTRVPMGIPVMTVTNTLPEFFWLVNYLETSLSNLIWKPSTNATIAAEYKAICKHYAALTGTDDFTVSIQCHGFEMRGMSGPEDAARSGFAHLTQFIGTDTLPAMDYAEDYYGMEGEFIAMSVSATEHAVATSNILRIEQALDKAWFAGVDDRRLEAERLFMLELITEKFPTGIISYVADSFSFWDVLTDILPAIKPQIMARQSNGLEPGKLVIRPDSGDPVEVVCGSPNADTEAERKGAVQVLWDSFGGTITDKGYKLLDSHIGLIYGDSITTKRAEEILRRLEEQGFASGNIVFGVGSYTYQCNTRDTFGFAMKATHTIVNGVAIDVFKEPKTDSGKKSHKGLLRVDTSSGEYVVKGNCTLEEEAGGLLELIWKDGSFQKRVTLTDIRNRLA